MTEQHRGLLQHRGLSPWSELLTGVNNHFRTKLFLPDSVYCVKGVTRPGHMGTGCMGEAGTHSHKGGEGREEQHTHTFTEPNLLQPLYNGHSTHTHIH